MTPLHRWSSISFANGTSVTLHNMECKPLLWFDLQNSWDVGLQSSHLFYLVYIQADKVEEIRSYVHSGIAKAISYQCNCSFSAKFIRNGLFRCWNALNEFTYRSIIVGMKGHNATKLVGLLQQSVYSDPTLQVDQFELWVGTRCPVAISSLKLKGEGKCLWWYGPQFTL